MKIPGRSLDHKARPHGDGAAPTFVGIAIGNQAEHPDGILERAALIAAQIGAHGTRLDVDVMPGYGITGRSLDHVLDVIEQKAIRDDALIDWTDAADLQNAGRAGAVDRLLHMRADDLNELADRRFVNECAHMIFPPSL